jgi:membrane AbrB-like protein
MTRATEDERPKAWQIGAGFAAAAAGGLVFQLLGLPAPWIAGGSLGSAIAALSGLRFETPQRLRDGIFVLLGLMMGAGVTPDTLAHVHEWPLSLAMLIVAIIAIVWVTQVYLMRFAGLDRATAFFSSIPGALGNVMVMALATKADIGRIALQQSVRLLLLIVALPMVISIFGLDLGAVPLLTMPLGELALVAVCGVPLALVFHRLHVPGGLMNGAFLASALLHGGGIVHGTVPLTLQIGAYVVLSSTVGGRLYGISVSDLLAGLGHAVAAFLLTNGIALAAVAVVVALSGSITLGAALLAFAPGGLEAMMALSFALNLQPAYVATHHFVRFVGVAMAMPLMAAVALRDARD